MSEELKVKPGNYEINLSDGWEDTIAEIKESISQHDKALYWKDWQGKSDLKHDVLSDYVEQELKGIKLQLRAITEYLRQWDSNEEIEDYDEVLYRHKQDMIDEHLEETGQDYDKYTISWIERIGDEDY